MVLSYKNRNINYTDHGSGEAVILLHGFLENSTMWQNIIPLLSKNKQVICIDLPGHGQTECFGYVHTMELMAEAVNAVLNHLQISNAIFIGHSMGGYVALAYAELFAGTIKGLCLVNSTSKEDSPERKINRDRAVKAVKQNSSIFINMAISNLFIKKNRNRFANEIHQLKKEALKAPLQGNIAALEGMKIRKDREHILKAFNYAKLMMISKQDTILNYESLVNEAKATNTQIAELPDGHMSYIENFNFFSYNLMHFIENI